MTTANKELLIKYSNEINLTKHLDENELRKIGNEVVETTKEDDLTRSEWFGKYNEALKIAKQTIEDKNLPFENSSNVKLPLILIGCVQFNARIFPEIIQMGKSVQAQIVGQPTVQLQERAKRLSNHMSLQTAKSSWNVDTDTMLMVLPLIGTVFRKWTYDALNRRASSHLCLPTEIIVDNDISEIENVQRITHVLKLTRNEIVERIRFGLYRDVKLLDLKRPDDENSAQVNPTGDDEKVLPSNLENDNNKYIVYEQHGYLDLDDDGYKEPYIITVLKQNSEILRIAPRYDENSFIYNSKEEIVKIIPKNYFTAHKFLPSPDGTFLGVGFGQLLLQLNSAINSITNNLIDAGTLSNLKGGFISRDLRVQKGDLNFLPGEWKIVNNTIGQNLGNSIFPLPVSEPSQTLMALLNFLVEFGRQVANINDILSGSPAAANMPATSVVALVEQGTKIYNSILNRLFESLRKEFNILYEINKKYFNLYPKKDVYTETGFVTEEDYTDESFNIIPVANPSLGTDAVRLAKMQFLLQLIQDPILNKEEIYRRLFEVLGIADGEKLFAPPPEPVKPSPDDILKTTQSKYLNMQIAEILMKSDLEGLKLLLQEKEAQADAAYKAGQLAAQKVDAISEMAKTEALTSPQDVQKATQTTEKVETTSQLGVDYTGLEQQTAQEIEQNRLQTQQQQGYTAPIGQAPGQTPPVGTPQVPQLPPELDTALQNLGKEEPTSPQGVIEASK